MARRPAPTLEWALARLPRAEFAVAFAQGADRVVSVDDPGGLVATATVARMGTSLSGAPATAAVVADGRRAACELGHRLAPVLHDDGALELLGPGDDAQDVVDGLVTATGAAAEMIMSQRLWSCTAVSHPSDVVGRARPMGPTDIGVVAGWLDEFSTEALGLAPRGPAVWAEELGTVTGMRLWEAAGAPVSMVLGRRSTPVSARLGPVFTPPACRGHGYAAALTAAVSDEWLHRGMTRVVLLTDLANPTSNRLYARVGYVDVDAHTSWVVRRGHR